MLRNTLFLGISAIAFPLSAAAVCGDGTIDPSTEVCDDGNLIAGDGCDDVCVTESGWECTDAEFNLDFSEDYNSDMVHGSGGPSWTLSPSGRQVSQSVNSSPGVYVSTLPATGVTATFTLEVNTSSDDDFIGWAVGFNAGDFANPNSHWILFDWKQSDQQMGSVCTGYAGLAMHRVQGTWTPSDAWCKDNAASTITRANSLGYTGWNDYQVYTIDMIYNTNNVQIYVDGVLEFDENGFFPPGTFAFYSYSQEGGIFTLTSPTEGSSVCAELDDDQDGLSNNTEDSLGTDSNSSDSDGDSLGDFEEVWTYGTDPADADSDGDGLSDYEEVITHGTDANDADSDDDGLNDYDEVVTYGTDPFDDDADGDGVLDGEEIADGTNPGNGDSDGDGISDGADLCPNLNSSNQDDLDSDGIGDECDPDADGDGEPSIADGGNDCDDTDASISMLTWYADSDTDGFGDALAAMTACTQPAGYVSDLSDCNDSEATSYPGADEYCDGIDNDCNGIIDDDTALDSLSWYADTDADGYGDSSAMTMSCTQPAGYVADMTDCDDADADSYPGASEYCDGIDNDCNGVLDDDTSLDALTWYADSDADGFGNAGATMMSCAQPAGYVADMSDCDDAAVDSYPGAAEVWYDGIDQNCDGMSDYDQDGDGFDSADYEVDGDFGEDCDDENADIHPDADEMWYDDVDQNCDGWSDFDQDGDGFDSETYGGEDCDDARDDTYPGAEDEPYDGVITDCNRTSDYDADQDGFDSVDHGGDDCDDANSEIHPDAEEIWYDNVDQNCDGESDFDQDGDRFDSIDHDGEDCDDANSEIHPEAEEIWYDDVDQNCDGNDTDQDLDGYDLESDCDDEDPEVFPNANGLDESCNLLEDDGEPKAGGGGLSPWDFATEGCGCHTSADADLSGGIVWVLGLLGLSYLRRRES